MGMQREKRRFPEVHAAVQVRSVPFTCGDLLCIYRAALKIYRALFNLTHIPTQHSHHCYIYNIVNYILLYSQLYFTI